MKKYQLKKKKNGDIKKLLSNEEKIYFVRRLRELIKHGYMMGDSIEFLMIQNNASEEIIESVKKDLSEGKKLSNIFKQLNYPMTIISKVEFSENYGKIESMLEEVEKYLILKKQQKEKIIKTLRYPIFLIITLMMIIILFNIMVIPQFQSIYNSTNLKMSIEVKVLIKTLYYIPKLLTLIVLLIILFILYFSYLYKNNQKRFLREISKIPIINSYFEKYFSYQYSLEISLFLMSGFSIKTTLSEIIKKNYNKFFTEFSRKIEKSLEEGTQLEESIQGINNLDNKMSRFVKHGLKNSMLEKELKLYSDITLDTLLRQIEKSLKKIQPILFLLLAMIIIGLYLVILLPIFNMTSSLK